MAVVVVILVVQAIYEAPASVIRAIDTVGVYGKGTGTR
jgi:hypothetical protein